MRTQVVLSLFAGCLCLLSGARAAVDCTDPNSLKEEQLKCFTHNNITLNTDGGEIQNVLQNDPAAVCRQQEEYKRAMACAFDVAKMCLRSVNVRTDILPDAGRMAEGISYMCRHLSDFSATCSTNAQPLIVQCATNRALAGVGSMTDIKEITCAAFKYTYDCMKEHIAHCPGRTLEISLELTNQYLRPPACSPFDGSNSSSTDGQPRTTTTTTMAPMTTAQLLTTTRALPSVSCYSASSIQNSQKKCFQREGLDVQLPDVSSGSASEAKKSVLDSILANDRGIENLCRQKAQYQRALGCAMDVARECMPSGYEDYLPTSGSMHEVVDLLCDSADLVDFQCAISKASEMWDCGYNKGRQAASSGTSTQDLLCKAYSVSVDCTLEILPACGCPTTQVYTLMNMRMNPLACPPISTPPPRCPSVTDPTVAPVTGHSGLTEDFPDCGLDRTVFQCFQDANVDFSHFQNRIKSVWEPQSYKDYVQPFFNKEFLGKLCGEKQKYKQAIGCINTAMTQCVRNTEWVRLLDLTPTPQKLNSIIDDVCDSVDAINYSCVLDEIQDFIACGQRKFTNIINYNGWESVQHSTCQATGITAECLNEVLPKCGCPTSRLFIKAAKDLRPPVCPAIQVATPRCNAVTGEFVENGVASTHSLGLLSLFVSLVTMLGFRVAF